MHRLFSSLFLILTLFSSLRAFAQENNANANLPSFVKEAVQQEESQRAEQNPAAIPIPGQTGIGYPDLTSQAVVLVLLALLPFFVMLLTSFLKMVISLSLLRSALGVQQTPPNQVINGVALILSLYVMYPTGLQMYQKSKHILEGNLPKELFSSDTAVLTLAIVDEAKEPLRDFLIRNSKSKQIDSFYKLAMKTFPEEIRGDVTPRDFIIVIPAFITAQIKAAFEIGVLIYLPFFVIDLVTSNILLAMQMMMLSPLTISLPLKLLLLVMIDGWTVLLQGLVLSFN